MRRRCRCALLCLDASLGTLVRSQHHGHVAAVLLGRGLHEAELRDVRAQALQQTETQFGTRLLAAAEHDGDLDLRAGFEEANDVALLGLVVVRVDLGAELLLLDDGERLVLARFARLLRSLVLELPVVHDLADRRTCVGSYFDKIEVGFESQAECIFNTHDSHLFTARSDKPDLGNSDAIVDAGLSADGAS